MGAICSRGWGQRCPDSTGQKCTCKCGGENHGKAVRKDEDVPGNPGRCSSKTGGAKGPNLKMETYHFKGLHGCASKCGLNIFYRGNRAIVVFTELPDNTGTSVTNMIEVLATQVYYERLKLLPVGSILFVERYLEPEDHFDEVTLRWTGLEFKDPAWRRIQNANKFLEGGI